MLKKFSKINLIIIAVCLLLVSVLAVVIYKNKNDSQTTKQVYDNQEACERVSKSKCLNGQCDYKCKDYYSGWIAQ